MEEEDTQTYPAQNSSHPDLEYPTNVADLNKKRKLLEYELSNSGLPWPKNKIRDRCSGSVKGSSIAGSLEKGICPQEPINSRIADGLEEEESDNDSNSCIGTYDNATAFDVKAIPAAVLPETLYSLESRNISDINNPTHEGMEDNLQVEQGSDDCNAISEFGKNDMEVEEAADDDLMLYSNDAAPSAFVLSSGSWSSGQDARMGTRKPTIDQEFEQYFSMLML